MISIRNKRNKMAEGKLKYKTEYATITRGKITKLKHRVILEKHLGRRLKGIVHHIDGNKRNNNVENLQEMEIRDHLSLHNAGKLKKKPKGWEPSNKIPLKKIKEIINYKKKNMGLKNYKIGEIFGISDTKVGQILKDVGLNKKYMSDETLNKINRIRGLC